MWEGMATLGMKWRISIEDLRRLEALATIAIAKGLYSQNSKRNDVADSLFLYIHKIRTT
jgi:hypothetical protein